MIQHIFSVPLLLPTHHSPFWISEDCLTHFYIKLRQHCFSTSWSNHILVSCFGFVCFFSSQTTPGNLQTYLLSNSLLAASLRKHPSYTLRISPYIDWSTSAQFFIPLIYGLPKRSFPSNTWLCWESWKLSRAHREWLIQGHSDLAYPGMLTWGADIWSLWGLDGMFSGMEADRYLLHTLPLHGSSQQMPSFFFF